MCHLAFVAPPTPTRFPRERMAASGTVFTSGPHLAAVIAPGPAPERGFPYNLHVMAKEQRSLKSALQHFAMEARSARSRGHS